MPLKNPLGRRAITGIVVGQIGHYGADINELQRVRQVGMAVTAIIQKRGHGIGIRIGRGPSRHIKRKPRRVTLQAQKYRWLHSLAQQRRIQWHPRQTRPRHIHQRLSVPQNHPTRIALRQQRRNVPAQMSSAIQRAPSECDGLVMLHLNPPDLSNG